MRVKKRLLVVTMVISLMAAAASRAEVVDRIVAVVNNDIITLTELQKAISPYLVKINSAGYSDEQREKIIYNLRKDMLERMVERTLTDQEVKRLNLTVSDKEVDAAIERLKEAQYLTQEDLEKALARDGMTFQEYREKVRVEILRPRLINQSVKSKVVITEEEVKKYYEDNQDKFGGTKKYHVYNILIQASSLELSDSASLPFKTIRQIKLKLDLGSDFQDLAREHSDAPNAAQGGDLGVFEADTFADQLKDEILALEPGEYTDIIRTAQGYQIFLLNDIEEIGGKTLEEAYDQISKELYNTITEEKFRDWLQALKNNSHIKIML